MGAWIPDAHRVPTLGRERAGVPPGGGAVAINLIVQHIQDLVQRSTSAPASSLVPVPTPTTATEAPSPFREVVS